jgi:hypothetical protein
VAVNQRRPQNGTEQYISYYKCYYKAYRQSIPASCAQIRFFSFRNSLRSGKHMIIHRLPPAAVLIKIITSILLLKPVY